LYWLSRSGFETTLVDHTGIDIVAFQKSTTKRYGISVKSRSRTEEKASMGMVVSGDNYNKIIESCKFFGCDVPAITFVYDRPSNGEEGKVDVYLLSLATLDNYFGGFKEGKDITFSITDASVSKYRNDSSIRKICFDYKMSDWM
jgi:hypothetical protein